MSVVYGVLIVFGACLAAVAGLALVQRLVPATIRMEQNDVAGFIYAVLGVIYAVLLALVVIATWEEFGRARVTVETEANALAEIFWLAHAAPRTRRARAPGALPILRGRGGQRGVAPDGAGTNA